MVKRTMQRLLAHMATVVLVKSLAWAWHRLDPLGKGPRNGGDLPEGVVGPTVLAAGGGT